MLLRQIRRIVVNFSREKQQKQSTIQKPTQLLVFPTKIPIFPHYLYYTKINKYLYEYIQNYNIQNVLACQLRPGVSKIKYFPSSLKQMKQQLKLDSKQAQSKTKINIIQPIRYSVIFDQQTISQAESPIYYVDNVHKIFPIVSYCKINVYKEQNKYIAHLKAETRYEIDVNKYQSHLKAETRHEINMNKYQSQNQNQERESLMYVSGKVLTNQNILSLENNKPLFELFNKVKQISHVNTPDIDQNSLIGIKSIELMSGYLCTLKYFTPFQLYDLFKTLDLVERVQKLTAFYQEYSKFIQEHWKKLNQKYQFEENLDKQKEYVGKVYEHTKKMLGLEGDLQYTKKIKDSLATGRYPQQISKIILSQLANIQELSEGNPELNKKKRYINLLVQYPFGILSKQTFDLQKTKQILDEDHYGMKKVKERILQFIAVSKIKGQLKSKVLLLHGPPGVGKTSIVQSIAKSLNRPYGRISLGGQYDTSIIKGHRKTYVGAYPGRIFDTIFKSKAENPVILLDQIDKIQPRAGGASLQDVIMEVLDPIQNHKFKDQFMDIQIDLSKVLFICTANDLGTIFPPLLDRLQRIQVSGYTTEEKKQIFRRYVFQKSMQKMGIPEDLKAKFNFSDDALNSLIEGYCKQAGVRNLVLETDKFFRKIALRYVRNLQFQNNVTSSHLKEFLGLPKFQQARVFKQIPPKGVMIGLAYNNFGGSIMYIESAATQIKQVQEPKQKSQKPEVRQFPRGSLIVTGNLHDVMKQSCQLAYSYAKYITSQFFNNKFLEINDIHLNFPEIQIGKDGPSAGAAITCSLVSLALNRPAIKQIAMTGEIQLSGKVSAIGGVKEKTMGAKRQGITHLIFPEQNRRDIQQLQPEIKQGVTFYFADHFFDVMELVFGEKIGHQQAAQAL